MFGGFLVEVRLIAKFRNEVNNYFLLFLGAKTTRLKEGATAGRQFAAVSMHFVARRSSGEGGSLFFSGNRAAKFRKR